MTLARNIGPSWPAWRWPEAAPVFVAAIVWFAAAMPAANGVGEETAMADTPPLTTIGEGFAIQDDSAGTWVEATQDLHS